MSEFWPMRYVQKPTKESFCSWIKRSWSCLEEKNSLPSFLPGVWSCLEVQRLPYEHKTKAQNGGAESLSKPVSLGDPVTVIVSLSSPGLAAPDFMLREKNKSLCRHFLVHRKKLIIVSIS